MPFIFYTIYSIVGLTSYITRVVGRMGEENRIHISETTKDVLDKLGGFRCEYRAVLDLGVCLDIFRHKSLILKLIRHLSLVKVHIHAIIHIYIQARQCNLETFWLLGRKEDVDDESIGTKSVSGKKSLSRDSTRVAAQK